MTDREMAARMASIRTTVISDENPTTSTSRPSFYREEHSVEVAVTDEDYEFVGDADNVSTENVTLQRINESALYISQDTTLKCSLEVTVDIKVVRILESESQQAAKREETPVYHAIQNALHPAAA